MKKWFTILITVGNTRTIYSIYFVHTLLVGCKMSFEFKGSLGVTLQKVFQIIEIIQIITKFLLVLFNFTGMWQTSSVFPPDNLLMMSYGAHMYCLLSLWRRAARALASFNGESYNNIYRHWLWVYLGIRKLSIMFKCT